MRITADNLPFDATEDDLLQAFTRFGRVIFVKLLRDGYGQLTGFAEVEMPDEGEARAAIRGLNGSDVKGRKMNVYEAGSATDTFSIPEIFDI